MKYENLPQTKRIYRIIKRRKDDKVVGGVEKREVGEEKQAS